MMFQSMMPETLFIATYSPSHRPRQGAKVPNQLYTLYQREKKERRRGIRAYRQLSIVRLKALKKRKAKKPILKRRESTKQREKKTKTHTSHCPKPS